MNVTTSDDLEVAPIENFLVILGDHDITTASETDIARWWTKLTKFNLVIQYTNFRPVWGSEYACTVVDL